MAVVIALINLLYCLKTESNNSELTCNIHLNYQSYKLGARGLESLL